MNLPTHYLVLYSIAAAALAFWLCGLWFLLSTSRRTATPRETWDDDDDLATSSGDATVRGLAEVAGRPAELSAKAAAHLAQHGLGQLGQVKILEQADDRLAFESLPGFAQRLLRHGVLEFQAVGQDRTQIEFTVRIPRRSGLLATAWIIQMIGLLVLVIGFIVMQLWVAPHPNPAVHWQSAQMGQVIHFLWPPFLFAGIYRRVQRMVSNVMDGFVNNLPYLKS